MYWEILESPPQNAKQNMQRDEEILETLSCKKHPILHFYDWQYPAATYGYFVNPQRFFAPEVLEKKTIDLARRPTGGGIVFHHCDLAFSVLVPSTASFFSSHSLDNYAFVNQKVIEAVEQLFSVSLDLAPQQTSSPSSIRDDFCMAKPTKYDVLVQGRKVGGAAQRKTRYGYLHQGSILLGSPSKHFLDTVLREGATLWEAFTLKSFPLLGEQWTPEQLLESKNRLKGLLKKVFQEV